eukprot:766885-Hanusia_phi.AAC.1
MKKERQESERQTEQTQRQRADIPQSSSSAAQSPQQAADQKSGIRRIHAQLLQSFPTACDSSHRSALLTLPCLRLPPLASDPAPACERPATPLLFLLPLAVLLSVREVECSDCFATLCVPVQIENKIHGTTTSTAITAGSILQIMNFRVRNLLARAGAQGAGH